MAMSGGIGTTQNPSTGASVGSSIEDIVANINALFPKGTFRPGAVVANTGALITSGALKPIVNKTASKPGSGKTKGAAGGNVRTKYAEGTTNAKGGMSIVGERGAELRVLNRGDGIIPADITKNLWKWGTIDPERIKSGTTGNIETYNIDVDNVNLPDVTSPEEFISGIKNLALQKAYNR